MRRWRCALAALALGRRFHRPIGILDRFELGHRAAVGGGFADQPVAPRTDQRGILLAIAHHPEVDLAAIEVDAADLHAHARADGVTHPRALAAQLLAHFVEAV